MGLTSRALFGILLFQCSGKADQPLTFLSMAELLYIPRPMGTGENNTQAAKEDILINSNKHRERGLFWWLSKTLNKHSNMIHLHVTNSRSSEKKLHLL